LHDLTIAIVGGAVVPACLLVAAWLGRHLIITRLARSVGHEFDQKLAQLQSNLTQDRARESAVTGAAMGAITAAQVSAGSARIDAATRLWKNVLELRGSNTAITMLDTFTADELAQLPSAWPERLRDVIVANPEVFRSLEQHVEFLGRFEDIEEVRPLISDGAWAYYFGYRAYTLRILYLVRRYKDDGKFVSPLQDAGLQQIAASILTPAELEHCRKMQVGRLLFALRIVEKRILDELRNGIAGKQASEDSLKHAQQIMAAVTTAEQQSERSSL
jgi:hypothetical protein